MRRKDESVNKREENIQKLIDILNGRKDLTAEEIDGCLKDMKSVITTHNFDKSKNELQNYIDEAQENDINFDFLEEESLGFITNHVTCEEFNGFTGNLENCLLKFNENQIKSLNSFIEMYTYLNVLDKDYIEGILLSLAENISNVKKIQVNQKDIEVTVKGLQKTKQSVEKLHKKLGENFEKIDSVEKEIINLKKRIDELEAVRNKVDNAKPFNNIDTMGDDIETLKQKDAQEADSSVSNSDDKRINEIGKSSINKKINIAYAIAGSSILLTVIQFALHIFNVI